MVCIKLLIVNVDFVLQDNGDALREIKRRYPTIAQLFHFRKSHHVHFVGPATAHMEIMMAANEVYALAGEPFTLSQPNRMKLVEFMTRDKDTADIVEFKLREEAGLFEDSEGLARDDKPRLGWNVSGPMYGVCGASHQRRRELMQRCIQVLNREYRLGLELEGDPQRVDVAGRGSTANVRTGQGNFGPSVTAVRSLPAHHPQETGRSRTMMQPIVTRRNPIRPAPVTPRVIFSRVGHQKVSLRSRKDLLLRFFLRDAYRNSGSPLSHRVLRLLDGTPCAGSRTVAPQSRNDTQLRIFLRDVYGNSGSSLSYRVLRLLAGTPSSGSTETSRHRFQFPLPRGPLRSSSAVASTMTAALAWHPAKAVPECHSQIKMKEGTGVLVLQPQPAPLTPISPPTTQHTHLWLVQAITAFAVAAQAELAAKVQKVLQFAVCDPPTKPLSPLLDSLPLVPTTVGLTMDLRLDDDDDVRKLIGQVSRSLTEFKREIADLQRCDSDRPYRVSMSDLLPTLVDSAVLTPVPIVVTPTDVPQISESACSQSEAGTCAAVVVVARPATNTLVAVAPHVQPAQTLSTAAVSQIAAQPDVLQTTRTWVDSLMVWHPMEENLVVPWGARKSIRKLSCGFQPNSTQVSVTLSRLGCTRWATVVVTASGGGIVVEVAEDVADRAYAECGVVAFQITKRLSHNTPRCRLLRQAFEGGIRQSLHVALSRIAAPSLRHGETLDTCVPLLGAVSQGAYLQLEFTVKGISGPQIAKRFTDLRTHLSEALDNIRTLPGCFIGNSFRMWTLQQYIGVVSTTMAEGGEDVIEAAVVMGCTENIRRFENNLLLLSQR